MIIDSDSRGHQLTFRTLLQAMSRPGRLFRLNHREVCSQISPLVQIAACLLDAQTGFWVSPGPAGAALTEEITRTGAHPTAPAIADFLFLLALDQAPVLAEARRGEPEAPETGATALILADLPGNSSGERYELKLAGPGIEPPDGFTPELTGIPRHLVQVLQDINQDFPLGVDVFLVRPAGEVLALPRSVRYLGG